VRTTVLFLVVLVVSSSGCTVGDERTLDLHGDGIDVQVSTSTPPRAVDAEVAPDVCALASGLPATNICSMICDPDAMKAAMRAAGDPAGRCYELDCVLPDTSSVYVGVCLEPEPRTPPTPTFAGRL
jgi:hypothetical protein